MIFENGLVCVFGVSIDPEAYRLGERNDKNDNNNNEILWYRSETERGYGLQLFWATNEAIMYP